MSKNTTKRSLLASVFALVLCVAMLVGSTFAWFTDTVSTGVNKITSGKLDVKLSYLKDGKWEEVKEDTKLFKDGALWEPGYTEVAYLKVENAGNLALKYQLSVNVANEVSGTNVNGESFKLSDYIKMGVVEGQSEAFTSRALARAAVTDAGNIATYTKTGSIAANDTNAQYVALVVYMPETVGNEANYVDNNVPSIDLGVKLVATQYTEESDSFDKDYDAGAEYATAVGTANELSTAISAGENVVLKSDLSISNALTVPEGKTVNIDMNGKTVTATGTFINVQKGSKLTLTGGTVNSGRYVFNVKDGEVAVNDADLKAQECVYALFSGSKLTVNGGTYTSLDNAVIATNGSSDEGSEIRINGGVFNANIISAGYIACGVYVANKDIVTIDRATFNVVDGVGILMRAGNTTIGKDVVINLTNTGKVTAGKVGDANIDITTPSYLVMDVRSGYPGATAGFTITNYSGYDLVEYK